MAAVTDIDVIRVTPDQGLVEAVVQTRNTVDAADTIAIVLADIGIAPTGLLWVGANVHTTDGSVMTVEAVTTSVTTGTLTITIPAGTDNDTRVIRLLGKSITPKYA